MWHDLRSPPRPMAQVKESISHLSLQLPEGHDMGRSVKIQTLLANYFLVGYTIGAFMTTVPYLN